jgi:putative endonuclease
MFYVYILYSAKKDRYYVGQTGDLDERLLSHAAGISPCTSSADDWTLVHSEAFPSRTEAIRREREIKKKKSRKYIQSLIQNHNPH